MPKSLSLKRFYNNERTRKGLLTVQATQIGTLNCGQSIAAQITHITHKMHIAIWYTSSWNRENKKKSDRENSMKVKRKGCLTVHVFLVFQISIHQAERGM